MIDVLNVENLDILLDNVEKMNVGSVKIVGKSLQLKKNVRNMRNLVMLMTKIMKIPKMVVVFDVEETAILLHRVTHQNM